MNLHKINITFSREFIITHKITSLLRKLNQSGFIHIVMSSILVKMVSFISAMFLPRIITDKAEYGLLVYVDNIRSYVMLLNGFGIANATLRFVTKEDDDRKKKGIFLTTLAIGIVFDIVLVALTIIAYIIIPMPFEGVQELSLLMSLLPIFYFLFQDIQLFLRACFDNKKYSVISFIYTFSSMLFQVFFAYVWSVKGVILGRYIAIFISLGISGIIVSGIKEMKTRAVYPSKKDIFNMVKFGVVMMLSNATSLILQLNETFVIAFIINDEAVLADYRVASYIFVISTFFVQSVAIFIFPHFSKRVNDKQWIWSKFLKLTFVNFVGMLVIHGLLWAIGELFIVVVFGRQYLNVIPIMRLLLVASFIQTSMRMIPGNILAATGAEGFNLKLNILIVILHCGVSILTISRLGIYGAAWGLIVAYLVSGVAMIYHLYWRCNKMDNDSISM